MEGRHVSRYGRVSVSGGCDDRLCPLAGIAGLLLGGFQGKLFGARGQW
jgi:hypothetical protein